MAAARPLGKPDETRLRILDAALALFREQGFDQTTMRDIAASAGVALGAAYYYFASKDALVLDFYRRASGEMQPRIKDAVAHERGLELRLRALIRVKLDYFSPNRGVLRALLRNGADPKHPLSPFSPDTLEIRDVDMAWFGRILAGCGIRISGDLEPHLPAVLWFFQMGIILFWVIDDSPDQGRTTRLLDRGAWVVARLVRLSSLPLLGPVRKVALELIEIVTGEPAR